MMAAREGLLDNVRWLIAHGADVNARADLPRGNSALALARRGGHEAVVRALVAAGAR